MSATEDSRFRLLEDAVRYVIDTFRRDEEQGYRSKDRQFAISILSKALEPKGGGASGAQANTRPGGSRQDATTPPLASEPAGVDVPDWVAEFLNRRTEVEGVLRAIAKGSRPALTVEKCRALADRLSVPSEFQITAAADAALQGCKR